MKDRAGNELEVGDKVLYLVPGRSSSWLEWGVIDSFTPKKVRVAGKKNYAGKPELVLREPSSVVKPFKEPCIYDCTICHEGEDEYDS